MSYRLLRNISKGFFYTFVVIIFSARDVISSVAPACSGKTDGEKVSNIYDCNTFFECKDGIGHANRCKEGFLFDIELYECKNEGSVQNCNPLPYNQSILNPKEGQPCPPGPTAPDCRNLAQGTFVTDTIDCNKYYVCRDGQAVQQKCQTGLWFDDERGVCNYPEYVNCPNNGCVPQTSATTLAPESTTKPSAESTTSSGLSSSTGSTTEAELSSSSSSTGSTPTIPTLAPSTTTSSGHQHPCPTGPTSPNCTASTEGGLFVDLIDCNKYYSCKNGVAVPYHCNPGKWFDEKRSFCNFQQLVDCPYYGCSPIASTPTPPAGSTPSAGPSASAGSTTETGPSASTGTTTEAGSSASAGSTTSAGTTTEAGPSASTGTTTEAGSSASAGSTTSAGTTTEAGPSASTGTTTEAGSSASAGSTTSAGTTTETGPSASTGTTTEAGSSASAGSSPSAGSTPSTTTSSGHQRPCPTGPTSPNCTTSNEGGLFVDLIDCNKYYSCKKSLAVLHRCNPTMWFDEKRSFCNFQQLVNCPNYGCTPVA